MPQTATPGQHAETFAFAERIAQRIAQVHGVAFLMLGGSWARGEALPGSDLDIGIYYEPGAPPPLAELRALAAELADPGTPATLTAFGGWGPWINGGGWLAIGGRPVDWIYRDLSLVRRIIGDAQLGRHALQYQPGHPMGFSEQSYLGELHHGRILADPSCAAAGFKERVRHYPRALRDALVRDHLWEAGFTLETAAKGIKRGDAAYVAGSLFRCVACMNIVLFAINGEYLLNEKGATARAARMKLAPPGYAESVGRAFELVAPRPEALAAAIAELKPLAAEVDRLAKDAAA